MDTRHYDYAHSRLQAWSIRVMEAGWLTAAFALPLVFNLDPERLGQVQPDGCLGGVRVLDHIVHCFLNNAEKSLFLRRFQGFVALDLDRDRKSLRNLAVVNVPPKGSRQPTFRYLFWAQL